MQSDIIDSLFCYTNKMKIISIIITVCVLNFMACVNSMDCEYRVVDMDANLNNYLINELDKTDFKFNVNEKNNLCIELGNREEEFFMFMDKFFDRYIPRSRSVSADPILMQKYKKQFNKNDLIFEEFTIDGKLFYVWEVNVAPLAEGILTKENNKYFSTK